MNGFRKVIGKRARLLAIHERVREQLRTALIERHAGAATQMIARETLAALAPAGPRVVELNVRFLRRQADGIERELRATARAGFLLRQVKRIEEQLHEED
jgi:hypothetical protein